MQFMQTLKKSNFFQDFFQKQRLLKVTPLTYKGTNVKDFPILIHIVNHDTFFSWISYQICK